MVKIYLYGIRVKGKRHKPWLKRYMSDVDFIPYRVVLAKDKKQAMKKVRKKVKELM